MPYDFNELVDRCGTDSVKWCYYPQEALPLWVADMDFRSPQPVIRALHQRVEHGVFGYGVEPSELREVIIGHLKGTYDWDVSPDWLVFFAWRGHRFQLGLPSVECAGRRCAVADTGVPADSRRSVQRAVQLR